MATGFWTEDDIIYTYTRKQALVDGVLIDVSETAAEAGFLWPVAVTAGVWDTIENIPPKLNGIQGIKGRLWDCLFMAQHAARRGGVETLYRLQMDRNEDGRRLKMLTLKLVSGPGDDMEPVITIMLKNED